MIVGGKGVLLLLADGRSVIDGSNTSGLLGHSHPALVQAMRTAATYPIVNDMWGWKERDEAAQDLLEIAFDGEPWVGGVRFLISGSEANDQALSLAQALTDRDRLVAREGSYHGGVGLAREVTLEPQWHGGLSSLDGGVRHVPRSTDVVAIPAPRCGLAVDHSVCESCDCADAASIVLAHAAAVIMDNTQGGVYPSPVFQDRLAEVAEMSGALWIADEVVSGLGRFGSWFAFQRGSSRPDMVTIGKGLTGGATPGAAVVVSKELMDGIQRDRWQSYGTFRGHTASLIALRTTLRVIESDGLLERIRTLHGVFERGLLELAAAHSVVEAVVGEGAHWTVHLRGLGDHRGEQWAGDGSEPSLSARVSSWALERDVLIGTSSEPSMVFVAPPLIIGDEDVQRIFDGLDYALMQADRLPHDA